MASGRRTSTRIWVLADAHIGGEPTAELMGVNVRTNLRHAIKFVMAQAGEADHIVLLGDISHDGSAASYEWMATEVGRTGLRCHSVPGNHDGARYAGFRRHVAPGDPTRLHQDWSAAFLDTRGHGSEPGRAPLGDVQRFWADWASETSNAIFFMHHDLIQPVPPGRVGIPNAGEFMLALTRGSNRQILVVGGHRHQYYTANIGSVAYVSCGAISCQFEFDDETPVRESEHPELISIDLYSHDYVVNRHILSSGPG